MKDKTICPALLCANKAPLPACLLYRLADFTESCSYITRLPAVPLFLPQHSKGSTLPCVARSLRYQDHLGTSFYVLCDLCNNTQSLSE